MGKNKSDNAEVAKRVDAVLRLRLKGAQLHDIVHYGSLKEWDVGERQIKKYIAKADQLLVERRDRNRRQVLTRHLAQRQLLFARALKAGDNRTALAVLADDAKLRGLYPDTDLKELAKLATSQGARIAELERRLRDANTGPSTPPQTGSQREETGPTE